MAQSDLDRKLLGDGDDDERLDCDEQAEGEGEGETRRQGDKELGEDEYDRQEREEDVKLLDEVEAALDAEEAAAAGNSGEASGEDKERGKGAETATARDRQGDKEKAALSPDAASAEDQSSATEGSQPSTPVTQTPQLTTQNPSALAKRDTRALARRENGLSESQHRALAMLAQGLTIPQAAMKVGIGRATLYRWTKFDARFRAAYNTWKQELRESCRAALLKCADAAVARIAQRVEVDENLAFKVIKELGLFKDSQDSATVDPQLVRHEIEIRTLSTERSLQRAHFLALCAKSGITEEQAKDYFDWKKLEEGHDTATKRRGDADKGDAACDELSRVETGGHGDAETEHRSPTGHSGDDDADEFHEEDDDLNADDLKDEDEEAEGEDEDDSETDETGVSQVPGLGALAQLLMRQGLKGKQ